MLHWRRMDQIAGVSHGDAGEKCRVLDGVRQALVSFLTPRAACFFFPSHSSFFSPVKRSSIATMFKRYAKDLPEEVLNWRLGYAVLGMLGSA